MVIFILLSVIQWRLDPDLKCFNVKKVAHQDIQSRFRLIMAKYPPSSYEHCEWLYLTFYLTIHIKRNEITSKRFDVYAQIITLYFSKNGLSPIK